jgi:ABC-type sugar transport system permease subunit
MRKNARERARRLIAVILAVGMLLCMTVGHAAPAAQKVDEIKVEWYSPNGRWDIPLVCFEVMRQDPTILCTEFSPLKMQGGMGYQSGKVMAFATGAGPDVFNMWTYEIASYMSQGFLLPLNEFIGHDGSRADGTKKLRPDGTPDVNGTIDDDEAIWDYWKTFSPIARKMVTRDGIVYSIPARRQDYVGLLVRKDLLKEYGVDVSPPKDWDDFYHRMQQLTWPDLKIQGAKKAMGRRGLYLHRHHIYLYAWVWAAGGRFVMEGKTNPETGKTHWYPKEETKFIDPETGASLYRLPSKWKATLTTDEVFKAYDYLWKLFHAPWIRDAETREIINLTEENVAALSVKRPSDGAMVSFNKEAVIRGVARTVSSEDSTHKKELFERGEIVVFQAEVGTEATTGSINAQPHQIAFWAIPPRRAENSSVVYIRPHWLGLSPSLTGEKNRAKRHKAWKIASSLGSDLGKRMYTRYMVEQGNAKYMTPEQLKKAGFEAYIDEIPEEWKRDYKRIFNNARFEPFNADWMQVARNELAPVFERIGRDRAFNYKAALREVEHRANTYIMGKRPEKQMRSYRRTALVILIVVAGILCFLGFLMFRSLREKAAAASLDVSPGIRLSQGSVYRKWLPWLMLAPALVSVALWAYYPLIRGTAMAFMDYRLMGERTWIGMDNFINVILDHQFQQSVFDTLRYVVIALGMTFLAPIILAIMLNEIPWFKQTYRTLFFLPQVSSGVVMLLLWKKMFESSERGYLNKVVATAGGLFGGKPPPVDWLGSTFWAPICVVVPTLWAGMGMGSLIYLAALKSVPNDLYEAADIDGAGLWQKTTKITLPTLYPLLVINFVGAFIGTFHQMQNIFVMTGGSSGTRVLSLHIWLSAYADLKFGPATATAWVLGSMLIGFTVWQLRILKKVEFRRAEEN